MCEFYIVRYYITYIGKQKEELESLNAELEREKELSNYAFLMLAELSEDLGEAMVGINESEIQLLMAERGK